MTAACNKDPRFHAPFVTMIATYQFIDRSNGLFNSDCGFMKDYSAIISAAWDIDTLCDNYITTPDDTTYNDLVNAGIIPTIRDEMMDRRENKLRKLARASKEEFDEMRVDAFAKYKK